MILVLKARLEYLKCEYNCFVVANDNTREVSQNYRRIKVGTTGMSPNDLQDLKLAQEITAHSRSSGTPDRDLDSYRGGRGGQNYRGRPFNRRGRDRQDYSLYNNLIRSNDQLPNAPHNRSEDTNAVQISFTGRSQTGLARHKCT